jgi:hypothetical protein
MRGVEYGSEWEWSIGNNVEASGMTYSKVQSQHQPGGTRIATMRIADVEVIAFLFRIWKVLGSNLDGFRNILHSLRIYPGEGLKQATTSFFHIVSK